MKKFILTVIGYLLALMVIVAVPILINYKLNGSLFIKLSDHAFYKFMLAQKKIDQADVVIFGDSKSLMGIDSAFLSDELTGTMGGKPDVLNLSIYAQGPVTTQKVFSNMLKQHDLSHVKLVIYNVTYRHLVDRAESWNVAFTDSPQGYFQTGRLLFVFAIKQLLGKKIDFSGMDVLIDESGDFGISLKNAKGTSVEDGSIKLHYQDLASRRQIKRFKALRKFLSLFPKETKKIIVDLPAEEKYLQAVTTYAPESYQLYLQNCRSLEDIPNTTFVNLIDRPVSPEYFYNADHVYVTGRQEYTRILAEAVKSRFTRGLAHEK